LDLVGASEGNWVALIPQDVIEQIQRSVNIVDVVLSYFPLKRSGRNFVALCPFHAEKTPSFNVNPSKQIFKCFGCGKAGDVFGLVMAMERVEFPQAVRMLAERAGIVLPEAATPGAQAQRELRERMYEVNQWAARLYGQALREESVGRTARLYLEKRGFESELVERFGLGYAPDSWDYLYRQAATEKLSVELLEKAGLLSRRQSGGFYDTFRGRLMFPITDVRGRVVGFGGRALVADQQPKYLNTSETALFDKSRLLYGLAQGREAIEKERQVIVVEGYTDCLMAHQVSIAWTVATLGTALTARHVRLLRRYADDVVLVFDADEAGERAAARSAGLFLAEGVDARVAILGAGMAPYDFLVARGRVAFLNRVREAEEVIEHVLSRAEQRHRTGGVRERAEVLEEMASLAADCSDPLRQNVLVESIAQRLGTAEARLRERVVALSRRGAGPRQPGSEAGAGISNRVERELIQSLLARSALVEQARQVLDPEQLEDETARRALGAVYRAAGGGEGGRLTAVTSAAADSSLAEMLVKLAEEKPEEFDFEGQFEVSLEVLEQRGRTRRAAELDRRRREAEAAGNEALAHAVLQEKLALQREQDERRHKLAEGQYQEVG
jgi:DNA primase